MFDIEKMQSEGNKMTEALGEKFGVELTQDMATTLFEKALGKTCMELHRLSVFYGEEADKCRSAEAYFSACLLSASAIETLLALLCLLCQKEVEQLKVYSELFKGKKRGLYFEEKVLGAFFIDYAVIAAHLGWLPSDVVDPEILDAALKDFPVMSSGLYPKDSVRQRLEREDRFRANPGIEMLSVLQDMRNLIHGPRWPRLGIAAAYSEFQADCKFVFVISFQLVTCLFEYINRLAKARLSEAESIMNKLTPEGQELLRKLVVDLATKDKVS